MLKSDSQQFLRLIQDCQKTIVTGIARIDVCLSQYHKKRSRVLIFENGLITYAGVKLPNPQTLIRRMGKRLNLRNINAAIELADRKLNHETVLQRYIEFFVQLELFDWQDFEIFIQKNVIWSLEQIFPYTSQAEVMTVDQPICYPLGTMVGFQATPLIEILEHRQREWLALTPLIPSLEAVPVLRAMPETGKTSLSVMNHLQQWIDGQRSLMQIAHDLEQDPLMLAYTYYHWVQKGWITCEEMGASVSLTPQRHRQKSQPLILSVDDSAVMQTLLKKSICDRYQVLLADNAVDALNLLNRYPITLLLLDVTMPGIDGLELCRTIRSIGKFKQLPVIMLTAKDGMFDKLKGQMAGSTHYLTKPITRAKLLAVIEKYLPTPAIVES